MVVIIVTVNLLQAKIIMAAIEVMRKEEILFLHEGASHTLNYFPIVLVYIWIEKIFINTRDK